MRAWFKMFICLVSIWGFIKIVPVVLNNLDSYKEVIEHSEELGIDNSTLFYSEEPLSSVAEQELKIRLNSEIE